MKAWSRAYAAAPIWPKRALVTCETSIHPLPLRQPECPVEGLPEKTGKRLCFPFLRDVTRGLRREQHLFVCNVPTRHLSNGTVMTQTVSFPICCNS
jgi:hypothetical protein